jgi:type II secretory pathway component PulJ
MKKNDMHQNRHFSRNGFTLVEVLVSSALTLVVMSMLFTILIGAMNAWQAGTGRLQGNADARMALDILASDLQSMVARQTTYNQEWLVSDLIATPSDPSGRSSTHLLFFAPSLDRDAGQQGDIVAISYRVGYQDALAGMDNRRYWIYGLYKTMATTSETFTDALGQQDIRNGFWNSRNTLAREALLIPNVVDFRVSWIVELPDGSTRLEPSGVILRNQLFTASHPTAVRIVSAELSLTILTDEGAGRVQTLAAGNQLNPARMNSVIEEFGRVYTKRVQIQY